MVHASTEKDKPIIAMHTNRLCNLFDKPVAQSPIQKYLFAGLVYLSLLLLLYTVTGRTLNYDGRGYDGRFYAALSGDELRSEPFIPVAPYCYRILTPVLVSYLPGPVVDRFRVFNFVVWALALLAWHRLARRTGLSHHRALFGGLFFATSAWGPMFAFHSPCYIDPLMFLFILVGLNVILAGRLDWLSVLLPIAMLQREQCILLWVCALAYDVQNRGWSRQRVIRFGLMLVPCAGVYLGLRWAIHPILITAPVLWRVFGAVVHWMITDVNYLLISILSVCYALSVPLVGFALLPEARIYVRRHRWMWCYLLFSFAALFGGSDKARLVFLAQPVLILAFLHGLGHFRRLPGWRAGAAALLLVHLYLQWPPSLMVAGGRLQAPLIDTVEHGTHGASIYYAAAHPVALATVAAHLVVTLCFACSLLIAWKMDKKRAQRGVTSDLHDGISSTVPGPG